MDILYGQVETGGGGIAAFLPFILIMIIIYFLMIRPQTKRQKEKEAMREGIKKGDKVITMGGIYGTVQGFKEKGRQADETIIINRIYLSCTGPTATLNLIL